ncbi:DEAD/DEAH box helicase domain-containing protein [Ditylenchus destructor]|uniref:SWI/SNF-related matrix-associated actin-dependent regulator of chromatin subfamily A containing DEAD/H box 1 homolog n=1 Tax=Ditylenchus destructor TaxID=166010 RepID=A0AAD4RAX3_9BILA|nr:DEAD/DEAH box helicase domain-containing protein [Ditylenchus destructor]
MSAGSFDDGGRKRVAHSGAGSSAELLKSLAMKRQAMGEMVTSCSKSNSGKYSPSKKVYPIFKQPNIQGSSSFASPVKRRKRNSSSSEVEVDDNDVKKLRSEGKQKPIRTFIGKSFASSLQKDKETMSRAERRVSSSDDNDESGWLCKPNTQVDGRTLNRKPPPKTNFLVSRRAVLSSSSESEFVSEEEEKEEDDYFQSRKHQNKSLKDLAKHAKHLVVKRKATKRRLKTESSESDMDEVSEDDEGAASFDSEEDSDNQYGKSKSCKNRKEIEKKCLHFLNTATMDEIKSTKKFNDRFMDLIEKERPFDDFDSMYSQIGTKLTSQIDQYLEYLENRGILDQILDNCTLYVEKIEEELQNLQQNTDQNICSQPKLLNSSCILHPYQQIGLQWLIMMHKLGFNAILADEMGLGKTIQIIAFLAWAKEQPQMKGPHLIVVPSSTLENWMNELQKWCPAIKVLTYYGSIEERGQLRYLKSTKDVDIILTTYNMATSRKEDRGFFKLFSLNYIIYDEGHMLRSCATHRYKNLMQIQGQRKILLTGTPLQNNLVELISLLYFTCTKLFSRYCHNISNLLQMFVHKKQMLNRKTTENNRKHSNAKTKCGDENGPLYERHKIAQAKKILQPFVLRRLKTQVLTVLPKKFEEVTMCLLTETQDELYNDVLCELQTQKESSGNTNYMGFLMQMRQVANHPLLYRKNYYDSKLREMAKLLCLKERQYKGKNPEHVAEDLSYETDIAIHGLCNKYQCITSYKLDTKLSLDSGKCKQLDRMIPPILERGEKLLIFSQFTTMLDILELYLEYRNHRFFRLDGSTPVMERQELINQFNTNESIPVFLLSTKAGGLGINLTAANHIIIHDIDINPYNDKQAEDRCHRMGQMREVFVTRLVSKGTVEESMLALAKKKLELEKCVTASSSQNNHDEEQFFSSKIAEEVLSQVISLRRANSTVEI